jgi:hypothetical protein
VAVSLHPPLLSISSVSAQKRTHGGDRGRREAVSSPSPQYVLLGLSTATSSRRSFSVVQNWLPALTAKRWLPSMSAASGVYSTSRWRPLEGLTVASLFFTVPSSVVLGTGKEGHGGSQVYSGGGGGPDGFF